MAHHHTHSAHRSAVGLGNALQEDNQRAPNCFTVNSTGALDEGVYLTLHAPKPDGSGEYPPHLKVGHNFLLRNRNGAQGCIYRPSERGGLVRRAEIVTVTPIQGKPFQVINCPSEEKLDFQLLHVHFGMAKEDKVHLKERVYQLNIWHGVFGTAEPLLVSGDQALIKFTEDGQEVHVMYPSGLVRSVVREHGYLRLQTFSNAEMAEVRVGNAKHQLGECDSSEHGIKRRDGILFGIIKLLELTRSREDAREVIVDFLREQDLSRRMRGEIRVLLVGLGDKYALEFADDVGFTVNNGTPHRGSGPSREVRARKALKAEKDRELRQQMRGGHGGGGGKSQQVNQKKGKGRKRK